MKLFIHNNKDGIPNCQTGISCFEGGWELKGLKQEVLGKTNMPTFPT
jgi:hypothetical protein